MRREESAIHASEQRTAQGWRTMTLGQFARTFACRRWEPARGVAWSHHAVRTYRDFGYDASRLPSRRPSVLPERIDSPDLGRLQLVDLRPVDRSYRYTFAGAATHAIVVLLPRLPKTIDSTYPIFVCEFPRVAALRFGSLRIPRRLRARLEHLA